MTQKGETEHFTDADHVRVLNEHLQAQFVDTVLVNTEKVPENYMDPEIYDEYLVQVKQIFEGLREEGIPSHFDRLFRIKRWRSFS